jgi:hypothetical protein
MEDAHDLVTLAERDSSGESADMTLSLQVTENSWRNKSGTLAPVVVKHRPNPVRHG